MTHVPVFTLEPAAGKDVPDALHAFLDDHKTSSVEIHLGKVSALSGRHIEVLLAAHLQWRDAGNSVLLTQVDDALEARLVGFGIPAALFSKRSLN